MYKQMLAIACAVSFLVVPYGSEIHLCFFGFCVLGPGVSYGEISFDISTEPQMMV